MNDERRLEKLEVQVQKECRQSFSYNPYRYWVSQTYFVRLQLFLFLFPEQTTGRAITDRIASTGHEYSPQGHMIRGSYSEQTSANEQNKRSLRSPNSFRGFVSLANNAKSNKKNEKLDGALHCCGEASISGPVVKVWAAKIGRGSECRKTKISEE